jgi:DNA-binding CsgD family transcriptional regulator
MLARIEALLPRIDGTLWVAGVPGLRSLIAAAEGDLAGRIRHLEETIAYVERHGFRWPLGWATGELADACNLGGDGARSLELWQSTLAILQEVGDISGCLDSLVMIAGRAVEVGRTEDAALLLEVVATTRAAVGHRRTWLFVNYALTAEEVRNALDETALAAVRERARATSLDEAITIAQSIARGEPAAQAGGAPTAEGAGLTPREREILQLLAEGKSNQEIGDALFISPRTAGTHVANILAKLGVHSRAGAIAAAHQRRLLP